MVVLSCSYDDVRFCKTFELSPIINVDKAFKLGMSGRGLKDVISDQIKYLNENFSMLVHLYGIEKVDRITYQIETMKIFENEHKGCWVSSRGISYKK